MLFYSKYLWQCFEIWIKSIFKTHLSFSCFFGFYRVKCNDDDTIGDLKKLIAAQTGTRSDKIVLKKWYTIFKDHITLGDYEIHDGMNLELYYQ